MLLYLLAKPTSVLLTTYFHNLLVATNFVSLFLTVLLQFLDHDKLMKTSHKQSQKISQVKILPLFAYNYTYCAFVFIAQRSKRMYTKKMKADVQNGEWLTDEHISLSMSIYHYR